MKEQSVFVLSIVVAFGVIFCTCDSSFGDSVIGWGYNGWGECDNQSGTDIVDIAAGGNWSLALKADGSLKAWGRDEHNVLSTLLDGNDFVAIDTTHVHGLALKANGSVVAWGNNTPHGQCNVPPEAQSDVIAIAAGGYHSLALKADGSVIAWGRTEHGICNVPPEALSGVVAISAGGGHNLALKEDGSIVAWGQNAYGEVSQTPTGNNFVAISASAGYSSLALKDNGSLVAWGFDQYGQVSDTPDGNDFVAIDAGGYHNLAKKADGSIVGWGANVDWNGNYAGQSDVPDGNKFITISAGCWHSIALTSDVTEPSCEWSEHLLIATEANESLPLWSPDGKQIAYLSDESGSEQLYIINSDGTGKWQVTTDPRQVGDFVWSPDSQYILYGQLDWWHGDLIKCRLNSSRNAVEESWNLTHGSSSMSLRWQGAYFSPDGKWIASARMENGWPRLRSMTNRDADAYEVDWTPIGQQGNMSQPAAWKPDSSLIAYAHHNNYQTWNHSDIWTVEPDGQNDTKIVDRSETGERIWSLAFSPDGEYLAFSDQYDEESYVGIVNADGSNMHKIDSVPSGFTHQHYSGLADIWSSDGKSIVYSCKDGGNWNIYLNNKDGSKKRLVVLSTGDDIFARFSVDGQLAFQTNRNGNWDIYISECLPANTPPDANAGDNIQITSAEQAYTVIQGTAMDPDEDPLQYRWLEANDILLDWNDVGTNGEAYLDVGTLPYFSIGNHTLTLEVSDGELTDSDDMILTIQNSPPEAQPAPIYQVVEIGIDPIVVVADVADFDGDTVSYEWRKDSEILASGTVETILGGEAVPIPDLYIAAGDPRFPIGVHQIELQVSDSINAPVIATVSVEVTDFIAPSLSPIPSTTILWPPNHKLVPVTIQANAFDNGGGIIHLEVKVQSSEPPDANGDGSTIPDYYIDSVDDETGIIELRLRAERAGSGEGRTYTIVITATDESGNQSVAIVEILAPHDRRKK